MPEAEAPARPPIDPEELAAFIDGRLEGERRRLMIARLAEDEDAYDLYDEVVRVREELAVAEAAAASARADAPSSAGSAAADPSLPPAEIAQTSEPPRKPAGRRSWTFPTVSRPRTVGWFPVAAAAAAAVVAFGAWWLIRPPHPLPSTDLLAAFDPSSLTPEAAREAPESLGTVYRGTDAEERAALFKLGVRAFDLALAIRVRDPAATEDRLAEMTGLLDEVPLAIGLPELYERLEDRLAAGAAPGELFAGIAAAERAVEEGLDDPAQPLFAFGRWVEAVRVAAARGDRTFLASSAARRPLRRFLRSDPSEEVARQLETVAAGLGRGAATADLAALVDALEKIENHCADGRPCLGPATE